MEREGTSAADLVNDASEAELANIFHFYGEERRARAIARAIIERRRTCRFETTEQLAELVAGLVRTEPGIHPATRVFQALRIAVNDELGELVLALHAAERILKPGGRLAVVTFHSLEDRIVKQFMAARAGRTGGGSRHLPAAKAQEPSFALVTKGPVLPSEKEAARNPRARSAKLRAAERTAAPAQDMLHSIIALAELPQQADARGRRR
jgi:16S rRNA (cytosine1402-N4)-methyltransferase